MRPSLLGFLVLGLIVAAALATRAIMPAGHHVHSAMAALDLAGFLTLGLLGGFGHCVGMCSPFVLFVSRAYSSERRSALAAQAYYAVGRLLTYSLLGALAALLGAALESAGALVGVHRAARAVAGTVLLAWAVVVLSGASRSQLGGRLFGRIAAAARGRMPGHPFAMGVFLGLLPCGLLYSAVIAAVPSGGPLKGALALALFGLGTAPALVGVSVVDELLLRHRSLLDRLSQIFILAMGARLLWTALSS